MNSAGRVRWWVATGVVGVGIGAALFTGVGIAGADTGGSDSGATKSSSSTERPSQRASQRSTERSSQRSTERSTERSSQRSTERSSHRLSATDTKIRRASKSVRPEVENESPARPQRPVKSRESVSQANSVAAAAYKTAAAAAKEQRSFDGLTLAATERAATDPVAAAPKITDLRPEQVVIRFLRDLNLWRNTAPQVTVIAGTDPTEQTAQGTVRGADLEGDPLSYSVVRGPRTGTVAVDSITGAFTYTPGVVAAQADSFAVAVDDGMAGGVRVVVVSVNLVGVPTPRQVGVTVGHSGLQIPRPGGGFDVPADWYFPTGDEPPRGIIWLQHGFLADKAFYPALATTLAEQTNSIVIAPSITSDFLTSGGYWLNGRPMQRAVADLFVGDRAQLQSSAAAAGYTGVLPQEFVLAGHSAGGGFAATVAGYTVDNGAVEHLAGVVMFDGVAMNEALPDALAKLGTVPVYQIAAPSQQWNAFDRGTDQLLAARPDRFTGVVLNGGSHVDALLGGNPLIDIAAQLVTQISPPGNHQAAGSVAVGWINDFYDGTELGVYGLPGQQLVIDHVGVTVLSARTQLGQFELLVKAVTSTMMRLLFDGGGEAPAGVRVGHSGLELADGVSVDAAWYFPDGEPTGVIYLQHGFFRSNANVSALAVDLARQTNSIVVAPTLSSNFLGTDPYWINGTKAQVAVAGLFAGDRDGDMARGLSELVGVPVYQISAEPCVCNAFGSGPAVLEQRRPGQFTGVRLAGGSHVDAEGASTDLLGALACGFSRPGNPAALQSIAAGWITDMFEGTSNGVYVGAGEQVRVGQAVVVGLGSVATGVSTLVA
ncbi:MAG: hypothetical protein WBB07_00240 [Mycobacterium sp.]